MAAGNDSNKGLWAKGIIAAGGLLLSAAGVVAVSNHEGLRYAAYPTPRRVQHRGPSVMGTLARKSNRGW